MYEHIHLQTGNSPANVATLPPCRCCARSWCIPGRVVTSDDDLRRQFTDEVPVVFIDGRKAFKYRMDEREFLRKLAS